MKQMKLGTGELEAPVIGLGCLRMIELEEEQIPAYLDRCMELGINFFDNADIYYDGECERRLGNAVKEAGIAREDILIQSKCGIIPGRLYDLSYDYIIKAVDSSLERLQTAYLDVLLLHRPDALVEPEEVAQAFDELYAAGKVRHFGVSNHKPAQIELLRKYCRQEIQANQLQLSVAFANVISNGIEFNMMSTGAVDRTSDVLDYCRLNSITIQAWSPFQGPRGQFVDNNDAYPDLNWALGEISAKYGVTKNTIAAAWILRHPAKIQLLTGTMNPGHLSEIAKAAEVTLTRDEWYRLYTAADHILP